MPYNRKIDERIQKIVSGWKHTDSKKMFGGVCRLLHGNMYCGVYKDYLILRLGVEEAEKAFKLPHVKPFDITGKPMKGWVMVSAQGFESEDVLSEWLHRARAFASSR